MEGLMFKSCRSGLVSILLGGILVGMIGVTSFGTLCWGEEEVSPTAEAQASENQDSKQDSQIETGAGDVEAQATEHKDEAYGKTHGLLGPVTLGPSVTLLAIPTIIRFGLEGKYKNSFGFGGHYGFIPSSLLSKFVKDVTIKVTNYEGRVRWFAFQRALFLGLGLGQQNLEGSKSENIKLTVSGLSITVPATVNVKISTTFLTPHFGWRWTWNSGFFMGLDLGYQVALSSSTTLSSSTLAGIDLAVLKDQQQYKDLDKKVQDEGNKVGKTGLPSFTLIHFGFLF